MKTLWGEITKQSSVKLIFLGVVLMAATATATYLVTEQGDDARARTPAPVGELAQQGAPMPGAASPPVPGQPGVLYVYNPAQGFVPVGQLGPVGVPQSAYPNGLPPGNGPVVASMAPAPDLYPSPSPGFAYQDATPAPEPPRREVRKKVVHVHHHHTARAAASGPSPRKEGGLLSGMSKTTKWALIGGALGASGGALIGGRGKHKAANGALTGAAIGTVTGGLLGHAMEKK